MIEYRVRPIVRYQVTRFHAIPSGKSSGAGCETVGVFDSEAAAERAREAFQLADAEHQEGIRGEGNPYVLVEKLSDAPDVRYASSMQEVSEFLASATKDYRLFYRR